MDLPSPFISPNTSYDETPGPGTNSNSQTSQENDFNKMSNVQTSVCQTTEEEATENTSVKSVSSTIFEIDKSAIPSTSCHDQELTDLGVCAYDQAEFETEVLGQVDKAIKFEEEQRRQKDIEKEQKSAACDIRFVKQRLAHLEKALSLAPKDEALLTNAAKHEVMAIKKEQENKLKHLKKLEAKMRFLDSSSVVTSEDVRQDISAQEDSDIDDETLTHLKAVFTPKETEEESLIRMGQMTPFGTVMQKTRKIIIPQDQLTDFDKFLLDQVENQQQKKSAKLRPKPTSSKSPLKGPPIAPAKAITSLSSQSGPSSSRTPVVFSSHNVSKIFKPKKMKLGSKHAVGMDRKVPKVPKLVRNFGSDPEISDFEGLSDEQSLSDKDYVPGEISGVSDANSDVDEEGAFRPKSKNKKKSGASSDVKLKKTLKTNRVMDDGCHESYIKRLRAYEKQLLIKKHQKIMESEDGIVNSDDESVTDFDTEFKVPLSVWDRLYKYQQTGVRWLWELHQLNCGGIVGDEMGLGKTIQIIAFLAGLKTSKLLTNGDQFQGLGPVILVCPTTVMHQWVKEFHSWWPPFRVAVLHETGSFSGKKGSLVAIINERNGILITSYVGLVLHQEHLLRQEWHYVILDEGHKIRNPDSQATLVAKQFRTPHRLILSGSPVQNNLKELWSLFDFIFPGKLGTLPTFMQQFSVPIVQGGYANATQVQVQTAYKCASVLRDTIKPYLLRRMKADVKMSIQLPNKNEQVLFCKLSEEQVELYKGYLGSIEVQSIISARLQVFVGLIKLRKICNHPDLFTGGPKIFKDTDISNLPDDMHYGYYKRSGKMIVVEALLRIWHKQGHRVLLFTQSRQMMEILELFVKSKNYPFMRMDGSTSISSRQPAIDKFNSDPSIFIFLLTTRVGGLGVNLTGADRVIIFDPDWNPSTDAQARERSWRIGQDKQVTIYRLLTAGTIEEKIYHRQIFKQFVTNRVLKDPRQRRFFKSNDLYELFTFSEMGKAGTETSAIFAGTGSEIKPVVKPKSEQTKFSKKKKGFWSNHDIKVSFSSEKVQKMKELAKKLSMQISKGPTCTFPNPETRDNKSGKVKPTEPSLKIAELKNSGTEVDKIPKREKLGHSKVSKRPKKNRKMVVDGESISYLVKKNTYKNPDEEEEKNTENDDYVLSKLFKNSGVHTALKHDVIVDASDPDYMLVEGEANRVAQDAIKALKQSRRQCSRASEGIPTWTGLNGGVRPRFGLRKKLPPSASTTSSAPTAVSENEPGPSGTSDKTTMFANQPINFTEKTLSSSEMLDAIRKRKGVFGENRESSDSDSSTTEMDSSSVVSNSASTEYDELLVSIRNFIAFRAAVDGQATTQELLTEFKDSLPKEQTVVFKSLLSKICDFSRASHGDGVWYLKEEFR